MPFIDSKISFPVPADKKEILKSRFGEIVSLLHKSEAYLMVGIEDQYDLWFAGKKLDRGAYVSVSLFGSASPSDYDKMTAAVCALLEQELSIPPQSVYVTYHPISDWGWNGGNF